MHPGEISNEATHQTMPLFSSMWTARKYPRLQNKRFYSWKCWSLKDAPCSPLPDSLLNTSTSATKRSKHNLLRGRVRGIGFKYHGACKPSHTWRIGQQMVMEGPAVQESVYHPGAVRHPRTPAPAGDQSSSQVQGLKLDSMAQEGHGWGQQKMLHTSCRWEFWGHGIMQAGEEQQQSPVPWWQVGNRQQ